MDKIICVYCGADAKKDWSSGKTLWFECGTMYVDQNRRDQTKVCANKERDLMHIEIEKSKNKIKLLKDAGDYILGTFCPKDSSHITFLQENAIKQWNQAKEYNE